MLDSEEAFFGGNPWGGAAATPRTEGSVYTSEDVIQDAV
jgi:hypothetical protein